LASNFSNHPLSTCAYFFEQNSGYALFFNLSSRKTSELIKTLSLLTGFKHSSLQIDQKLSEVIGPDWKDEYTKRNNEEPRMDKSNLRGRKK